MPPKTVDQLGPGPHQKYIEGTRAQEEFDQQLKLEKFDSRRLDGTNFVAQSTIAPYSTPFQAIVDPKFAHLFGLLLEADTVAIFSPPASFSINNCFVRGEMAPSVGTAETLEELKDTLFESTENLSPVERKIAETMDRFITTFLEKSREFQHIRYNLIKFVPE